MRTVVMICYPGAQVLDVTGPASVLAEAERFSSGNPYEIVFASGEGGLVRTSAGVSFATVALADLGAPEVDTILIPGALETDLRTLLWDASVRSWVVQAAGRAKRVVSVCTGAFALATWGLLDGRRATTHWEALDELAKHFPDVVVDRQALFVEDGAVWTSAGVSTGIDMTLALVERDLGRETAAAIARSLVLQMRRPGYQSQFSAVLEAQGGTYAPLVSWIADNLAGDLTLNRLAERAGQSARTFHRRFTAEVGSTPATFVERLRLDRARTLLEAGGSAKRAATACGFGSLDRFGRAFRRRQGLTPSAYRSLHGQTIR